MNLRAFPNTESLAAAAAEHCATLFQQNKESFFLALSGGRIAEPLCQNLAQLDCDLGHVHFFWADERCVPPTHHESNFAIAQHHLFQPRRITPNHVHRIEGELDPPSAAQRAEAELRRLASSTTFPVLDLIILGVGEDGHTASLFPAHTEPPGKLFYDVVGPKPPPHRVTMSYELITNARQILVLVSGPAKREVLLRSLHSGDTPIGKVLATRRQKEPASLQTAVWTDFEVDAYKKEEPG